MTVLFVLLLLLGAVCFALDAFHVVRDARFNLLPLGLLCWILVPLINQISNL